MLSPCSAISLKRAGCICAFCMQHFGNRLPTAWNAHSGSNRCPAIIRLKVSCITIVVIFKDALFLSPAVRLANGGWRLQDLVPTNCIVSTQVNMHVQMPSWTLPCQPSWKQVSWAYPQQLGLCELRTQGVNKHALFHNCLAKQDRQAKSDRCVLSTLGSESVYEDTEDKYPLHASLVADNDGSAIQAYCRANRQLIICCSRVNMVCDHSLPVCTTNKLILSPEIPVCTQKVPQIKYLGPFITGWRLASSKKKIKHVRTSLRACRFAYCSMWCRRQYL